MTGYLRCAGTSAALLLVAAATAPAQSTTFDTLALEQAFLREFEESKAPGATMAVVLDGEVAFVRAVGVTSVESGTPMTPATLFRIGSITKTFTGMTALLLADAGRLRLDLPIGRMTPRLDRTLGRLTLTQLLSHTAGLWNEGANDGAHDEDALARRVLSWKSDRIFAPAGDVYSYSSPGYWLAGHVLAAVEKKPYTTVVAERLLRPLGMTRSTFSPLMALTHSLALDHVLTDSGPQVQRPYRDDATTWPSGSLFSSAVELARFGAALASGGMLDGVQVLPAGTVQRLQQVIGSLPRATCGYSYGAGVCPLNGVLTFGHHGFRGGSGAVLKVVPSKRFAIVILANRGGAIFGATEAKAMELLLGSPRNTLSTSNAGVPGLATRATYAGRYIAGLDTITIEVFGTGVTYRHGETTSKTTITSSGLQVLDADGRAVQRFSFVRGKVTGDLYLHDGLNAFRQERRRPSMVDGVAPPSQSLLGTPPRR